MHQLKLSCRDFLTLATTASVSMHALLFQSSETLVKCMITLTQAALLAALPRLQAQRIADVLWSANSKDCGPEALQARSPEATRAPALHSRTSCQQIKRNTQLVYLAGFAVLEVYRGFGHDRLLGHGSKPFLPLMLTSVYCAFGVTFSWTNMLLPFVGRRFSA
jgi:alpha-1,3-glucosyltransferase